MLNYAVAGALLLVGLATSSSAVVAAPRNDDCVNCEPSKPYDRESPARIRLEMDRPAASDANVPEQSDTAATAEPASDTPVRECADCPPPKHYDKIEVRKTSHDVDRSRVINTNTVMHARPRVRQVNKLIIHENETRNVGVIQHNHRIIEKEIRYVKRTPLYRYAPSAYRAIQRVRTVLVPVVMQPVQSCGCPCSCSGGLFSALAQAHAKGGYAYVADQPAMQQVLAPMIAPAVYGYR